MENLNFLYPLSLRNKIRLGPSCDGGYVVYKPSLDNVDILFTYGVGWDIEFETAFYNLTNKRIVMYDPTMFEDGYYNKGYCLNLLKRFHFVRLIKYFLFISSWIDSFKYLEKHNILFFNEGLSCDSGRKKYNTFKYHMESLGILQERILLKIDIEENEYPLFVGESFYASLKNVDQIIIEFHNVKKRLRQLKQIIQKLQVEYSIVHIHGNNCAESFILYRESGEDLVFPDVIEVTLVRKSCIFPEDICSDIFDYPIPGMDFPNNPYRPDFEQLNFS